MIVAQTYKQNQDATEIARIELQTLALRYFEGYADDPLKTEAGQPDDNYKPNFAKFIVRTHAALMYGNGLKIEIGDDEADTTAEEEYLESVWPAKCRALDLLKLEMNGAIFGHCWAKIRMSAGVPRLTILDPQQMTVEYDPQDYERVLLYRQQYTTEDEAGITTYREDTERVEPGWVITEYVSRGDSDKWRETGVQVVWPYEFAPIFECQYLPKPCEFYGDADLDRSTISAIHYIHRIKSLICRIERLHAFPRTVAKNIRPQDLVARADGVTFLLSAGKETDLYNLEMQSDLTAARETERVWTEELYDLVGLPGVTRGKGADLGADSGVALKVLYGPAEHRVNSKRILRGLLIENVVRALLEIGKKDAKAKIEIHWPDIIPGNEKAKLESALLKKNLGVSQNTLLLELGYDPDHEKTQRETDTAEMGNQLLTAFDRGTGAMPGDMQQ